MKSQKYTIVFQPSGLRGKVADGTTILNAARQLGASLESICGGKGVCGKCKIRIEEGDFAKYGIQSAVTATTTRDEVNAKFLNKQQLKQNYRLACQTRIHGDVVVFVPEESRKGQQVVRKEATARKIKLNPAIKKYYVELKPATLDDTTGDFERLAGGAKKEIQAGRSDDGLSGTFKAAEHGTGRRLESDRIRLERTKKSSISRRGR